MAQRIFITGGTGYIGSVLLPILVARGHHVRKRGRGSGSGRSFARKRGKPLSATRLKRGKVTFTTSNLQTHLSI